MPSASMPSNEIDEHRSRRSSPSSDGKRSTQAATRPTNRTVPNCQRMTGAEGKPYPSVVEAPLRLTTSVPPCARPGSSPPTRRAQYRPRRRRMGGSSSPPTGRLGETTGSSTRSSSHRVEPPRFCDLVLCERRDARLHGVSVGATPLLARVFSNSPPPASASSDADRSAAFPTWSPTSAKRARRGGFSVQRRPRREAWRLSLFD